MTILAYCVLTTLMASKLFYISLFSAGSYNFTLSDACLLIMLFDTIIRSVKCRDNERIEVVNFYSKILFLSLLLMGFEIAGAVINKLSVDNAIFIYIKRWLSVILVPVYFYDNLSSDNISVMIKLIVLCIFAFFVTNFKTIISIMSQKRFFDTMNPNVLGMFISVLLVFLLFYKMKNLSKSFLEILCIITCICLVFVVASRGALFALIPVLLFGVVYEHRKLGNSDVLGLIIIIIMSILIIPILYEFARNTFSFSFDRISNTLLNGITNDSSAAARLETQGTVWRVLRQDPKALFFGVGFGNISQYFIKLKYQIDTADSQFFDLLAWCGIIGFFIFFSIIIQYLRRAKNSRTEMSNVVLFATLYLFLAGISQDSFTEPTITIMYMYILGFYEVSKKRPLQS